MPRLWNQTIAEHRRTVHGAILDTTAALVAEHGLAAVTMSRIAQETGIGRATLYKYFPDVESIMVAWHDRQIGAHLHQLTDAGAGPGDPAERLVTVLRTYATASTAHPASDLSAVLHRGEHVTRARGHLLDFVAGLVTEAVAAGQVRDDVPAGELAAYCLHAMRAAADLPPADRAAGIDRLVTVTVAGIVPTSRA